MTRCPTCRWYVLLLRRLAGRNARARAFAHAHHGLTRGAGAARTAQRSTRIAYRRHKATCVLRLAIERVEAP